MSAVGSHTPFRTDIEGLRAIAVGGVIAYHFGVAQLPGGFVGVDVFFVISGYLITRHILDEIERRGAIDLWAFYARRARRLLPASIFVILATLVAGYFVLAPSEQQLYAKGAFYASTYIINLWLIRWSLDYFAQDASSNPFIHFWSLSVEEQFYLAWPALLLFFTWLRPGRRSLVLLLALAAAISFSLCAWLTEVAQPWAFYLSPLRAWEFALGGIASTAFRRDDGPRPSPVLPLIGWLGVALIGWSYLEISEKAPFPGFLALVPTLGAAMVLASGIHRGRGGPRRLLSLPPLQWTGRLSYSLYLWHWPVIVYAAMLLPEMTGVQRLACLGLTFALSTLSYFLIENPMRRSPWLMAATTRSLGLAALLTATGAVLAYADARMAAGNETPLQRRIARSAELPSTVRQTDPSCVVTLLESEPKACAFGAKSSARTVVLFGDSHADHWSTPLISIAKQDDFRLVTFLKSSCRATRMTSFSDKLRRKFTECDEWRESAIKRILAMKPQMVIISQFSIGNLEGEVADPAQIPERKRQWVEGLRSTIGEFSKAGINTVYLRDVPTHNAFIDKCVARALWQGRKPSVCDTPRVQAADDADAATERAVIAGIAKARYVDLTDLFCDEKSCHAMIDGMVAFRDRHHLATPFAAALAGRLERAIFETANSVADAGAAKRQDHSR
ncbi:MAG: acyltransferase family protein [Rhizobiaceae bacterium]